MQYTNGNPAKIERNLTIAAERLAGKTYSELAAKFDISKTHVHAILNDDEIRDVIETGTKQLISLVPKAVDNYRTFLTDKDNPDHYKASKDCLQATGIMASHASSTIINNLFYQDNRQVISPEIAGIMRHQTDQQASEEAEYEVIDDD